MRIALILYTRAEFLSWCRTLGGEGGSHRHLSSYYERGSHIHCLLSSDHQHMVSHYDTCSKMLRRALGDLKLVNDIRIWSYSGMREDCCNTAN